MELFGRSALVTGGAHRVGKAIAMAFAEKGCNVMVHFHSSEEAAQGTVHELKAAGVKAHAFRADLRHIDDIMGLFQAVDKLAWGLDVLVNSAAVMERVDFRQVTEQDWETTLNLNLKALFFSTQQAAERMVGEGGVIINISDIAGHKPWLHFPLHSISKAGVEMLTKVSALTLAPAIRVNAVAPGPVLKPGRMPESRWEEIGKELPMERPGTAANVTRAVIHLCENDFITGETLVVDGGSNLM
jgi:NAD(P)-dependent dehydrogenase (short-subunit alcohol dehydrogenase family)